MPVRLTLISQSSNFDSTIIDAEPVRTGLFSFGNLWEFEVKSEDLEDLRFRLLQGFDANTTLGITDGFLAHHDAQLVMCDVDSTLTTTEAIDLLAEYAGKGDEVAAITAAAMHGELNFAESLRRRVAKLRGLPTRIFDEVYPQMTLTPGAQELIAATKDRGALIGVTSGGFNQLVGPLAEELGLDFFSANRLGTALEGNTEVLTGTVEGRIIDRRAKAEDLRSFAAQHDICLSRAVAVGDGANDLALLATAALGIAFCAKPVVAAQADIAINFPRLDAVTAFAFPSLSAEDSLRLLLDQ